MKITKKKNVQKFKLISIIATIVLVILMVISQITPTLASTKSDASTLSKYMDRFNEKSTKNSGRIWSDKTVLGDQNFEIDGHQYSLDAINGENFNIVYSAKASSAKIQGKTKVPVDIVFMVDVSGSMDNKISDKDGTIRIEATVKALNNAIDKVLKSNSKNRIAVTTWSSKSENQLHNKILVPLNYYPDTKENKEYIEYTGEQVVEHLTSHNNSVKLGGATATQIGISEGMNVLLHEEDTEGRVPVGVLLSDGNANRTSESAAWWDVNIRDDISKEFDYSRTTVMKTLMTAAYKKEAVEQHYNSNNQENCNKAKIYTIGLGVTKDKNDNIKAVLDPTNEWNNNNPWFEDDKNEKNGIKTLFDYYKNHDSVTVKGKNKENGGTEYIFKHPEHSIGIDVTDITYNDKYFDAQNSKELDNAFNEIINTTLEDAPDYPTEIENAKNPAEGGYITYTDPIGEYMEVKKVKSIIYNGKEFKVSGPQTNENITTYTGIGTIQDPITNENIDLNNVSIKIINDNNLQSLEVKIPAAAIPLKIDKVDIDSNGKITTETLVNPEPIRIVYSVGLKDGVNQLNGVSSEYIQKHIDKETNQVQFYSNRFSGKTIYDKNKSVGDATTSFTSSKDNPRYFITEDTFLYDLNNNEPVTENIDPKKQYYFETFYYENNDRIIEKHERTGEEILALKIAGLASKNEKGQWKINKGAPRRYHVIKKLCVEKDLNSKVANTADMVYVPEIGKDGVITHYLGNNGVIGVNLPNVEPGILDGKTNLTVKKELEGRNWTDKDSFRFNLSIDNNDKNTNDALANQFIILPNENDSTIMINKDKQSGSFGNITFKKEGIYKFVISEKYPKGAEKNLTGHYVYNGITYAEPQTFTVEVKQEGFKLVANIIGENSNGFTFKNTYKAKEAVLEGNKALTITKKYAGKNWTEEEFKFKLEPILQYDGIINNTGNQEIILTKEDVESIENKDKESVVSIAKKSFNDIKFNKEGIYKFRISEIEGNNKNINYAKNIVEITVNVADNGEGQLIATISKATTSNIVDMLTFENKFEPDPIDIGGKDPEPDKTPDPNKPDPNNPNEPDPSNPNAYVPVMARKFMDGRNLNDSDKWSFTILKAEDTCDDTPMPDLAVTNNDKGQIIFHNIRFKKSGTYKYIIKEGNERIDGVTNDAGQVKVTINVTYDADKGKLTPDVSYEKIGGDKTKGNKAFVNKYSAKPVDAPAIFHMKKTVISENVENNYHLKGNEFTFKLTPTSKVEGDPVSEAIDATNDANGNVVFLEGEQYTIPGEYEYTVTEVEGNIPGIKYSDKTYTIKVTVIDQGNGELKANVTAMLDNNPVDKIVFENKYNPTEDNVMLQGTKKLNVLHGNKNIADGDFTFEIKAVTENAPLPNQTIVSNIGQSFTFGNILYNEVGEYEYTISECNKSIRGYEYDPKIYKVRIIVKDIDGMLQHEIEVDGQKVDNPNFVFTNTYAPSPTVLSGETAIRVHKYLDGRNLLKDEFKFELLGSDVKLISTNDENGNVIFEGIQYNEPGVYDYSIKEVVEKENGIIYDEDTLYNVQVNVEDIEGQLVVQSILYLKEGVDVNSNNVSFNNIYKASGTSIKLAAIKTLVGDTLKAGQFEFNLTDSKGTNIQTAVNDENGVISFDELKFDKPGKYVYYISEKMKDDTNVTYDNSKFMVLINVEDNGKGNLIPSIEISKNEKKVQGISFINYVNKEEEHSNETIPPTPSKPSNSQKNDENKLISNIKGNEVVGDINSPITGVQSQAILWLLLLIFSGLLIFGIYHIYKQYKN